MALSAIIPVSQMASANSALEAQGFGPRNFSIAAWGASSTPSFAALHAWGPDAFEDAVKAIAGVVWTDMDGEPADRVAEVMGSQGASWIGSAQRLEGQVVPGLGVDEEGEVWRVIQAFDTNTFPVFSDLPALIRRVRTPGIAQPWVQPIDANDAYKLMNPFTGEPDTATHLGSTWRVSQADGSGNNVWAPGVFGWVQV